MVSKEKCDVCDPYVGVHFLFNFRLLQILKIPSCQAQGKRSVEFHGITREMLQFDLSARHWDNFVYALGDLGLNFSYSGCTLPAFWVIIFHQQFIKRWNSSFGMSKFVKSQRLWDVGLSDVLKVLSLTSLIFSSSYDVSNWEYPWALPPEKYSVVILIDMSWLL